MKPALEAVALFVFAIRKALPNAIFPSDIGCYTLGINQKAVDTCLDMGASIGMASGFYQAHRLDGENVPIVATIGDSTFFHAGIPPLLNAHVTDARFILVILDNGIVAMTGFQPTPASGGRADILKIVQGIGIRFVEEIDAYDVPGMVALVKKARAHTRDAGGGIAVIVAKHPCALHEPSARKIRVDVAAEVCDGCDYCLKFCECSGLVKVPATGKVEIDRAVCIDCGMCIHMCPLGAIGEVVGSRR
jgi:indolepyruvate ferredoxin oxidoreductase alpha subunit